MTLRDPRMPVRFRERLRAVLDSPVRLLLIVVSALALATVPILHDKRAADVGGPLEAIQFVGGVALLIMLVGWRWFWKGVEVRASLIQRYPDLRLHPAVAPVQCPCGCHRSIDGPSLGIAAAFEHCETLIRFVPASPEYSGLRGEGLELRRALTARMHEPSDNAADPEIHGLVAAFDAKVRAAAEGT